MRKRNQIISAITTLTPTSIIDTATGEYVSLNVLHDKVQTIIDAVHNETLRVYSEHREKLAELLVDYSGSPQAAEFARQKGINTQFVATLPREVKSKSRLDKLVQFKVISETSAYVNNPNPDKQEHSFNRTINLGAVDSQMASLSRDGDELNLLWKCWDAEYYLTFRIPAYVLKRNIDKFSLPTVKLSKKTGNPEFIFNVFENTQSRESSKHTVGIDLGKVIPYSMVVVNKGGARVASYETSTRLTRLSKKRERLLTENHHLFTKVENRKKRGLESPVHELELDRTRAKATRLTKTLALQMGSEITQKLDKHQSNLIKVEDLSWVSGQRKSKIGSSRWAHSVQQEAISHATSRIGYKTRTVSAKDTSQTCHKCKSRIQHRQNRTVWCGDCRSSLDRDFNAAMNIAQQPFPANEKLNGDTTNTGVTIDDSKEALLGKTVQNLPILARTTT